MKKKIALFVSTIMIISLAVYILFPCVQSKKMSSYFENTNITKIEITNGNNGYITVLNTEESINDVLNCFENLSIKKTFPNYKTGWNYDYKFYSNEELILDFCYTGVDQCLVSSSYYEIKYEQDIDLLEFSSKIMEKYETIEQ